MNGMNIFLMSSVSIVIDANIAVWTVLPSVAEKNVLDLWSDWYGQSKRIVAPDLWMAESVSVIRRLIFNKIILQTEGEEAINDLFALGVEIIFSDKQLCQNAFKWSERLQQSKIYDSLYVALAEQLQAEFWTADRRLVNGAKQVGVEWIHWIGEE